MYCEGVAQLCVIISSCNTFLAVATGKNISWKKEKTWNIKEVLPKKTDSLRQLGKKILIFSQVGFHWAEILLNYELKEHQKSKLWPHTWDNNFFKNIFNPVCCRYWDFGLTIINIWPRKLFIWNYNQGFETSEGK